MPVFLSFLAGVVFFSLFRFFPFSTVLLIICAASFFAVRKKTLPLLFLAAGLIYAFLRFVPSVETGSVANRELLLTGSFTSGPQFSTDGRSYGTFDIDAAFDEETGEQIDDLQDEEIRIYHEYDADPDGIYELVLKTGRDSTRMNPGVTWKGGLFGSLVAAREKGKAPFSLARTFDGYRSDINRYVSGAFGKDTAALVAAVTTGETSFLAEDLRDSFSATGLAHILSISGTHFGLFSIIVFGAFLFVIKRLPYSALQKLTLHLTPSQASALCCLPFMLTYLGLSGGSVPAVRSFVMITIVLAGLLFGRKGYWMNSLLCAACVLVLWDPEVIAGLSFQLSFLAVLFIGFAVGGDEKGDNDENERKSRVMTYIKKSFLLTLAAMIGTSPLAAYHFHSFPLISPISNLLLAPFIGFVLIPLSLISSFSLLLTGHYIFSPLVSIAGDISIAVVKLMAQIPFASLAIPAFPPVLCLFFYAGFLPYVFYGRKKVFLILPLLPFLIYTGISAAGEKSLSVTFLDVGQADSAVIELPDNKTIVIDTGRSGKEAAAFLKFRGKDTIDALVLTHAHPDHSGGLGYLMDRFQVKQVWDNGLLEYPEGTDVRGRQRTLKRGDIVESGPYRLLVLHPYKEFHSVFGNDYDEENNSSLVIKVEGKTFSLLLTGDIQEEAEEDILHLEKWLPSDVIKIPHHGSRTSGGERFLAAVSPSSAIISAGRDNPFGHPSPEILERLGGKKIYRTDRDGAVKFTETTTGFTAKTRREAMFEKASGAEQELKNIRLLFSSW